MTPPRQTALVMVWATACSLLLGACANPAGNGQSASSNAGTALPTGPGAQPPTDDNALADAQAHGLLPGLANTEPQAGQIFEANYGRRDDAHELARQMAGQWGLDAEWTWDALSRARFKESVTRYIMPPPPGTAKNWTLYRSRFVEPVRIRAGVQFWREHRATLRRAEQTYGVPASAIVGILGVETIYGRQMGNFRAIDALTTLSLDFPKGRSDRSEFFRSELGQLLKWCQESGVPPDTVMASYAGAIGMPQFMPSSMRKFAVDFDGDGRIDLLRSPADAIGSVASYLASQGWVPGLPGYFEVPSPQAQAAIQRLLEPDILPSFTPEDMVASGVNLPPSARNIDAKLALIALQNGDKPLVYVAGTANFYAVTRYNQSSYYALAVLQLGNAVQREAERDTASAK